MFHYNKIDGEVRLQKLSNPIVTNPIYNNGKLMNYKN